MTTKKLTKLLALYLPYILLGLVATNLGKAWRLAEGKELGERIMSILHITQQCNCEIFNFGDSSSLGCFAFVLQQPFD